LIEITVGHNLEKAMRVLKRKLIREGVFKELKARRFYEKPSEKRKRKEKEAYKKKRRDTREIVRKF
jgi:small subunit ribosomal protein S21